MEKTGDVLIIGAGMAGLAAAAHLVRQGLRVQLLDKNRDISGRMSTRRIDLGGGAYAALDPGAQFMTSRSPDLARWIANEGSAQGIRPWFSDEDGAHPRYFHPQGMSQIPKLLVRDIPESRLGIHLGEKAIRLQSAEWGETQGWWALSDSGESYFGHALVLTAPVPQSLALLKTWDVPLAPESLEVLEPLEYWPCLVLLAVLDGPCRLPKPGYLEEPSSALSSIADQTQKGVSPGGPAVVIQASRPFSEKLWDRPEPEVIETLWKEAQPFLGTQAKLIQLHRWRYSEPKRTHPQPFFTPHWRDSAPGATPPIYFAGDAFGGAGVEGAFLSGLRAAETISARRALVR